MFIYWLLFVCVVMGRVLRFNGRDYPVRDSGLKGKKDMRLVIGDLYES